MIQIFKIPVNREALRGMSVEERTLFLRLGNAANQISTIFKLVIFSSNRTPDGVEAELSGAQTQMLARILIGVLHESWVLIRQRFLSSPLAKEYLPAIDTEGRAALERMKARFGQFSILGKIRNDFVFHQPSDEDIEAGFDALSVDASLADHWHWYFSHSNYNAFYLMSDLVVIHGICRALDETDVAVAQRKLLGEVSQTSEDMTQFIMALTATFWRKHFGSDMSAIVYEQIDNAPELYETWIPFFVETPK